MVIYIKFSIIWRNFQKPWPISLWEKLLDWEKLHDLSSIYCTYVIYNMPCNNNDNKRKLNNIWGETYPNEIFLFAQELDIRRAILTNQPTFKH